jgi:YVTN family beta-propeller protein
VSDLNDELRHLADEAARQAQPLPVADVIRQGDRRYRPAVTLWPLRRTRTPRPASQARPGRRWPGWVAPLAAAGAVIAVVAGTAAVSGAIHGRRAAAGASPAHRVIAYVADAGSGTVIPIRTATNTALPPIKAGRAPDTIAITPDGKTVYVANYVYQRGTVTPIRTATNTALPPIKVGRLPSAIAITP